MNRFLIFSVVAALALVACSKKPETAPESSAPPSKPQATSIESAVETPPAATTADTPAPAPGAAPEDQKPEKITPLTEREVLMLNYSVYKFKEDNGRFPKSIQEMVGKTLPRMPVTHPSEKIVYDPNTGLIKVEKVKW